MRVRVRVRVGMILRMAVRMQVRVVAVSVIVVMVVVVVVVVFGGVFMIMVVTMAIMVVVIVAESGRGIVERRKDGHVFFQDWRGHVCVCCSCVAEGSPHGRALAGERVRPRVAAVQTTRVESVPVLQSVQGVIGVQAARSKRVLERMFV